jgi:hypothetical protein
MNEPLLDFLRETPEGLLQVDDLDACRLLLATLFEADKPAPEKMLAWACNSQFPDELLLFVADLFRPTAAWRDFLLVCLRNWDGWEAVDFPKTFTDEYAALGVRYYIAKGDLRRAWDKINKLRKQGFFAEGAEEAHVFFASPVCLKALVEELFAKMLARQLVSPLDPIDVERAEMYAARNVFETKPHSLGRKPRAYKTTMPRPGWQFAELFGTKHLGGLVLTFKIAPVGAMILKIAEHFAAKRSDAKKKKHQKALETYMAMLNK